MARKLHLDVFCLGWILKAYIGCLVGSLLRSCSLVLERFI